MSYKSLLDDDNNIYDIQEQQQNNSGYVSLLDDNHDKIDNRGTAQSNVNTMNNISLLKNPQAVQTPSDNQPVYVSNGIVEGGVEQGKRKASLLNPIVDIYNGAKNAIPQIPNMVGELFNSAKNQFTTKEGLANALPALFRGAVSGVADLVPSTVGLGADVINSIAGDKVINMPEAYRRPVGNAFEQWRNIQEQSKNLAIPNIKGQNKNYEIDVPNWFTEWLSGNTDGAENAQFAEMAGQFIAPMGVAGKISNISKASKAANASKAAKAFNKIKSDTITGAALGSLEGEGLEERASNATGMGLVGGALGGLHLAGEKALKSTKGKYYREAAKKVLKEATEEYPSLSKAIANADNALNTNLSEHASESTKVRKEYNDLLNKDNSIARKATNEQEAMLEKANKLTPEEQTELFERLKKGDRVYAEKEVKEQIKASGKKSFSASDEDPTIFNNIKEMNADKRATNKAKAEALKTKEPQLWDVESLPHLTKEEVEGANKALARKQVKGKTEAEINSDEWLAEQNARMEAERKANANKHPNTNKENKLGLEITKERYNELYSNKDNADLSLVKNEEGINTPKVEKTHQNKGSILPQNEHNKLGKEITKEEWLDKFGEREGKYKAEARKQVSDVSESNTTTSDAKKQLPALNEQIVKFDEAGLEELGKDMKKYAQTKRASESLKEKPIYEQDKVVLEPAKAEGVDEANADLYRLRTKGERGTNGLTDDNYIENFGLEYDEAQRQGMASKIYGHEEGERALDNLDNYKVKKDAEAQAFDNGEDFVNKKSNNINDTYSKSIGGVRKYNSPEKIAYDNRFKTNQSKFAKQGLDDGKPSGYDVRNQQAKQLEGWTSKEKTIDEKVKEIVKNKENEKSRYHQYEDTIKKNTGMSNYSENNVNPNKVYSGKTVVFKLKDVIKGEETLERMFHKFGDIDVHFIDKRSNGVNGRFNFNTNSIDIYSDCPNIAKTLVHECRHAIQKQLKDKTWFGSRWRKLFKSCEKRNRELAKFTNNDDIMDIVNNVDNFYKKLENGKITQEEFVKNIKKEDYKTYIDYIRARKRYRNSYLEIDARQFAGGDYGKRLFHQGEATIRSTIHKTKSTYKRFNKTINKSNEFGELSGQSNKSERRTDRLGSGQRNDEGSISRGNEENTISRNSLQINVDNLNKYKYKSYDSIKNASGEVKTLQSEFQDLGKRAEDLYRKYGTLSDEQMLNRVKKQDINGEGVYFLQGVNKSDGKIKLNNKQNDKIGLTGLKKYDDIRQKGTTRDSLERMYQRDINLQHADACIEFLKKNFDNKPKEGYIPVNTKMMFAAKVFGKSKTWIETLSKGEEHIRKVFDNKEQADAFVELANRVKASESDLYIPKDMFDATIAGDKELALDFLKTYGKTGTKNWLKGVGRLAGATLDFYNDRFKRKVLTSASFITNNRIGNQIMLMANANSPAEYFRGIKDIFTLRDSDLPPEIVESTLAETVRQEHNATKRLFSEKDNPFDNFVRLLNGETFETENLTGFSKAKYEAANICLAVPNKVFNSINKTMMKFNEKFERLERRQAFSQSLSKIQKDKILKDARSLASVKELVEVAKDNPEIRTAVIDRVSDILGDYNNYSKFEQNVMKRIVPFYAWNRTILRHCIALCKDNPTKMALLAIETYKLNHQDNGLEDYQSGAIKLPIVDKVGGKQIVINKANMIPYHTLFEMVEQASDNQLASVSPSIKKPLEALNGEKFFKPSAEITSKKYKKTKRNGKSGYVDLETSEFKEGNLPIGARAGYLGREALEAIYPMYGSPMTKGIGTGKDMLEHYNEKGELRLPDKVYDASLGGFYDGDKTFRYKGKLRKRSAKNKLSLINQILNRASGATIQLAQEKKKR